MIGSFFVRAIDNSISEGFILTKSRHLNHGQRSAFSGRFYPTDFCPIFGIKIARRAKINTSENYEIEETAKDNTCEMRI